MERNITIDDVGGAGLYLLSDLGSGVTGEVHHVDGGYHSVGMLNTRNARRFSAILADCKEKE